MKIYMATSIDCKHEVSEEYLLFLMSSQNKVLVLNDGTILEPEDIKHLNM